MSLKGKKDPLGERMKIRYEYADRTYLTRRVPAIIRIDGKAFHTFTRGMQRPFDDIFRGVMGLTMKALCENIQGCVLGYTQSDEITLVLTDYATINTDAWFGYNVQKMTSIAASMATRFFNEFFIKEVEAAIKEFPDDESRDSAYWEYLMKMHDKAFRATFDARAFSMPKDEVCNCLIWRQQDATRNSIESVGQTYFSHSQLHKKTTDEIQDMLFTEKGINWNDFPTAYKRGTCCVKLLKTTDMPNPNPRSNGEIITVERRVWVIDREIPIFTQDRDYIEHLI